MRAEPLSVAEMEVIHKILHMRIAECRRTLKEDTANYLDGLAKKYAKLIVEAQANEHIRNQS